VIDFLQTNLINNIYVYGFKAIDCLNFNNIKYLNNNYSNLFNTKNYLNSIWNNNYINSEVENYQRYFLVYSSSVSSNVISEGNNNNEGNNSQSTQDNNENVINNNESNQSNNENLVGNSYESVDTYSIYLDSEDWLFSTGTNVTIRCDKINNFHYYYYEMND
jgi:hypothetical protein